MFEEFVGKPIRKRFFGLFLLVFLRLLVVIYDKITSQLDLQKPHPYSPCSTV